MEEERGLLNFLSVGSEGWADEALVRVDEDVTALIPHRPERAQLTHSVLHRTDSLTAWYSNGQFEAVARETVPVSP